MLVNNDQNSMLYMQINFTSFSFQKLYPQLLKLARSEAKSVLIIEKTKQ